MSPHDSPGPCTRDSQSHQPRWCPISPCPYPGSLPASLHAWDCAGQGLAKAALRPDNPKQPPLGSPMGSVQLSAFQTGPWEGLYIHTYEWPQPKARDPTPLVLLPVHPCGLPAWHTLAVPCMYMESPCTPYIAQHPLPALSVCPLLVVSCCHPPVPACPSAPALVAFPVCSSAWTLCPGLAPQGAGGHWGGCQRWL